MVRRVIVCLFPRNRYRSAASPGARYFVRERPKVMKMLGGATRVVTHTRVYDRSSTSAAIDFTVVQGSFGEEAPAESPRTFPLTPSSTSPALPYNNTSMGNLPDDGSFTVSPTMGLVDVSMLVTGGANEWVECETWATAEFSS